MAHHIWATEQLIDACKVLTPEQLSTPAPGTYGSILETFRHLVITDCWYLTFFRDEPQRLEEGAEVGLDESGDRRSPATGPIGRSVLAGGLDGEADIVEHGDGWDFHSPTGLRLAQIFEHGTDHRSQICTALTSLGVEPPGIDLLGLRRGHEPDAAGGTRTGAVAAKTARHRPWSGKGRMWRSTWRLCSPCTRTTSGRAAVTLRGAVVSLGPGRPTVPSTGPAGSAGSSLTLALGSGPGGHHRRSRRRSCAAPAQCSRSAWFVPDFAFPGLVWSPTRFAGGC